MNIGWQIYITDDVGESTLTMSYVGYGETARAAITDAVNRANLKVDSAQKALDLAVSKQGELVKLAKTMFGNYPPGTWEVSP